MQRHQAWGTTTGIALALALAGVGCGGNQQPPPGTAEGVDTSEDSEAVAGEEEEMMADIDSYLEEEWEGDNATAGDGGEDAADAEESSARSTPKERTEQIYALIKAQRDTVADCYKAAKKKDPALGTRIAVTIVISPDGSLKSDPLVDEGRSDIKNDEVRTCAIDVVKNIKYPAHPKGMETTFTYPFGF